MSYLHPRNFLLSKEIIAHNNPPDFTLTKNLLTADAGASHNYIIVTRVRKGSIQLLHRPKQVVLSNIKILKT